MRRNVSFEPSVAFKEGPAHAGGALTCKCAERPKTLVKSTGRLHHLDPEVLPTWPLTGARNAWTAFHPLPSMIWSDLSLSLSLIFHIADPFFRPHQARLAAASLLAFPPPDDAEEFMPQDSMSEMSN